MKKYDPYPQDHPEPLTVSKGGIATSPSPVKAPARGFWRAFTSLRQRNFRLYWFGQMISLIGSMMQSIGQAWLVLELTHSGWQLGLVGALQALPVLLFSLFGGVFADRWPRRGVLFVTQSASMLQALLLWALIVTGVIQLWHLYILATLLGLTNCLDKPTRQVFVSEMVEHADLPNAVALNSSIGTLARVLGPGIGGLLIAVSGVALLFLLNGLSFLAVLVSLALINIRELHMEVTDQGTRSKQRKTWQSLREGVDYVWRTPAILLVIVVVGLVLLFGSNFNVVLPLIASNVLHIGAKGFGLLSAALGLGALLSALWLAWGNRQPAPRHVLAGTLVFGILEGVFALSRSYPLSLLLITGIGFAETTFAQQAITILQTAVPGQLRGRVMSVYILFFDGSLPLGYLLVGWLSGLYGASTTLLICAFLCLLIVGAGWLLWKPAERDVTTSIEQ